MKSIFVFVLLGFFIQFSECDGNQTISRQGRYVIWKGPWWPYNSAIALAIVLSMPLDLKGRDVFMAYNFETNYYLPYFDKRQGLVPLPDATIVEPGVIDGTKIATSSNARDLPGEINDEKLDDKETSRNSDAPNEENSKQKSIIDAEEVQKSREKRGVLSTFISRKKFYNLLRNKLDGAGFSGYDCLLRTICETAEVPLAEHNGILGDILHVVFTPSSSRDEKLSIAYYEAERNGIDGNCDQYQSYCPSGIFDWISKTVIE